jgi:hypothetical protein
MDDGAYRLFEDLNSYRRLEELIQNGETEGLLLECKSPTAPRLTKEMQVHLAKAVSGFSNTAGGVVIWGISTTKHAHTGLDVLSQIEPVGDAGHFEHHVARIIPTLTSPSVVSYHTKVVRQNPRDTKGVVLAHIPPSSGDPVQSNQDSLFYFRSGDDFTVAPYEMIKRLFSATESPDLEPLFVAELVARKKDGAYSIPITLCNASSAIAEHVKVSVTVHNTAACEKVTTEGFQDQSAVNPGVKIFMTDYDGVIHRGLNQVLGNINIVMKCGQRPRRRLDFSVTVYANKMIARRRRYTAYLSQKGFRVKQTGESTLY